MLLSNQARGIRSDDRLRQVRHVGSDRRIFADGRIFLDHRASSGRRVCDDRRLRKAGRLVAVALSLVLFSCIATGRAFADELKVFCSNGYREVMQDMVPEFERATGNSVIVIYDLSTSLVKRIDAGDAFDLAVLTPALVDEVVARGRLAAGDRATLARSPISLAIRAGRAKPDLSTTDAVILALTTSGTLAYAKEGASAGYFIELLKRLNLSESLASKIRTLPSGVAVAEAVSRGEVDLGVMPVSEILPRAGVVVAGSLPDALRGYITMTAGLSTRASAPGAARALVAFLISERVGAVLERRGMERPR